MPSVLSKLWDKILMPDWTFPYNCYEIGHTWNPSCTQSAWDISKIVLQQSFLMYTTLYVASQAAFNRKWDYETILQTINSILTSTGFLFFNGYTMFLFFCGHRKLTGKFYYSIVATIPAFISSLISIYIERASRRGALAIYCANVASECLFRIGVSKKFWKPIANGETLLFTVSMTILLYVIRKKGYGRDPISFVLKLILGRNEARKREKRKNASSSNEVSKITDIANNNTVDGINQTAQRCKSFLQGRHLACTHVNDSCIDYVLKGFAQPFLLGWLGQSLLVTFIKPQRFLNEPSILLKALKNQKTVRFGLFLGSFSALFKLINCSLRWKRNKSEDWHASFSAFIASLSMLIEPNTTIATYVAWKCIETLYCLGLQRGLMPFPNITIALVYAVSVNIIFYTGILEPSCLRPSYFRFIDRVTNHKLHLLNRQLLAIFGADASEGFEDYFPDLKPELCSHQFIETVLVWMIGAF